jgi:hypothetical protein
MLGNQPKLVLDVTVPIIVIVGSFSSRGILQVQVCG